MSSGVDRWRFGLAAAVAGAVAAVFAAAFAAGVFRLLCTALRRGRNRVMRCRLSGYLSRCERMAMPSWYPSSTSLVSWSSTGASHLTREWEGGLDHAVLATRYHAPLVPWQGRFQQLPRVLNLPQPKPWRSWMLEGAGK